MAYPAINVNKMLIEAVPGRNGKMVSDGGGAKDITNN